MNVWAQTPDFRAQVQAILGDAHQSTATMLEGQRMRAMEVLATLLENASPAIRLQAVKLILEATSKTTPTAATDTRFTAIMTLLQGAPTP